MGRKYYHSKKHGRRSGKAGLLMALASAFAGRGGHGYPPAHGGSYGREYGHGYAPYSQRRSLKGSILSYIFKRLLRRFS